MPKVAKHWTCSACGETMANLPMVVLAHQIKHAERRPFATSDLPRREDREGIKPEDRRDH